MSSSYAATMSPPVMAAAPSFLRVCGAAHNGSKAYRHDDRAVKILEQFRVTCRHPKIVRGGIFLGKVPLGIEVSAKGRIETAVMSYDDSEYSTIGCMDLALERLEGIQALKTAAVKRPIRGDKLFVQVVNGLAREIVRAGSERITFPAEPELCRIFGVSRTVLREAVKVLEAKGLVEVGHGQGVKSRDRANWNHLDPDVLNWQCEYGADEVFLRNMSEVRRFWSPRLPRLLPSGATMPPSHASEPGSCKWKSMLMTRKPTLRPTWPFTMRSSRLAATIS